MNREILFRGFHEDENGKETIILNDKKVRGEWVEGFYGKKLDTYTEKYSTFIIQADINVSSKLDFSYFYDVCVIPETVGQYKNIPNTGGVKMFEHNIVKMHYFTQEYDRHTLGVYEGEKEIIGVFGIDEYGTYIESKGEIYYLEEYLEIPEEELSVIGDIFSNPELLEANNE